MGFLILLYLNKVALLNYWSWSHYPKSCKPNWMMRKARLPLGRFRLSDRPWRSPRCSSSTWRRGRSRSRMRWRASSRTRHSRPSERLTLQSLRFIPTNYQHCTIKECWGVSKMQIINNQKHFIVGTNITQKQNK